MYFGTGDTVPVDLTSRWAAARGLALRLCDGRTPRESLGEGLITALLLTTDPVYRDYRRESRYPLFDDLADDSHDKRGEVNRSTLSDLAHPGCRSVEVFPALLPARTDDCEERVDGTGNEVG